MFKTSDKKVMIKGGGDLASGVAYRLYQSGFKVSVSEIRRPMMVRRTVSFGEAVYRSEHEIEGIKAKLVKNWEEFKRVIQKGEIPVFVNDLWPFFKNKYQPDIVIDGRMMKRDNDTTQGEAPLVIGLGPGFTVGEDVDALIETCRGHYLGRTLYEGQALPDTGKPGEVMGYTKKRVVYAPCDGEFHSKKQIGDHIEAGEKFGKINETPVQAKIGGVIRGQIHPGRKVKEGWKIGDVDPRDNQEYCSKISDKGLAVGGGVLEAILKS